MDRTDDADGTHGTDRSQRGPQLLEALHGVGGGPPEPGVLHVVAVPRFDPSVTSVASFRKSGRLI